MRLKILLPQATTYQPLTLGARGVIKARLDISRNVKLNWLYEIYDLSKEAPQLCVTGQVLIVPINIAKRKIVRRIPAELQPLFDSMQQYFAN